MKDTAKNKLDLKEIKRLCGEIKEMTEAEQDTYIGGKVEEFVRKTELRSNENATVILFELRQALTSAYNKGREDEKQEWKAEAEHEQEKMLDGFAHPKDCERCQPNDTIIK